MGLSPSRSIQIIPNDTSKPGEIFFARVQQGVDWENLLLLRVALCLGDTIWVDLATGCAFPLSFSPQIVRQASRGETLEVT